MELSSGIAWDTVMLCTFHTASLLHRAAWRVPREQAATPVPLCGCPAETLLLTQDLPLNQLTTDLTQDVTLPCSANRANDFNACAELQRLGGCGVTATQVNRVLPDHDRRASHAA
jgi:hypothetical protein